MKTIRTIFTGFLALFVLISTISHSVSFHICGGEIQNVAIFSKAQSCEGHDKACDHDGRTNQASLNHKGCCEDATFFIDLDKYASKITEVTIEGTQNVFLPVTYLVQEFNPSIDLSGTYFLDYRPPLIERDINILIQSFLI